MKTINKIIFFVIALSMLGITSCEKKYDTEGLSQITNYPVFEMTGDPVMLLEKGTPFVEPGITAEEAGVNIDVSMSVSGLFTGYSGASVDIDTPDKYIISYSATNGDGFTNVTQRIVWVAGTGDLVNSIEGLYTSTIFRNGTTSAQYTDLKYIMIWSLGGNKYALSDAIGGYYDMGRAYGDGYRAAGMTVTANDIPTNDFSFGSAIGVGAFGGVLEMTGFTVDEPSKTITFSSEWDAGYTFDVTLTQVQL